MPRAELRDGAEIRCIKRHDAHEIDALTARLGNATRGVDAAAVGIEQQRRHHGRVEWRLAPLTAIGAADLDQVQIVSDQAQYKAGEMALSHKILHPRGQKQRLIDLPGAECLAHAAGENLTRASLASKIRYYSDRLLAATHTPIS